MEHDGFFYHELVKVRDYACKAAGLDPVIAGWKTAVDAMTKQLTDAQATVEALQRERDELREMTKVICGHCCEPMAIPSKAILQSHLSALQGLVRALPVVETELSDKHRAIHISASISINSEVHGLVDPLKALLDYRRTLDATTPEEAT